MDSQRCVCPNSIIASICQLPWIISLVIFHLNNQFNKEKEKWSNYLLRKTGLLSTIVMMRRRESIITNKVVLLLLLNLAMLQFCFWVKLNIYKVEIDSLSSELIMAFPFPIYSKLTRIRPTIWAKRHCCLRIEINSRLWHKGENINNICKLWLRPDQWDMLI